ncbi:MAG: alpha-amylase family protein [Bryobacteraceae bacterium]|jgi:hypothetical protein
MDIPRREFLVTSGALISAGLLAAQQPSPAGAWYEKARRYGHSNFSELDPLTFDVGEWLDYWASLKVDALFVNAGGTMAFYPTKIPHHYVSRFLGRRDLFGEFTAAAKSRGIRVLARVDPKSTFGGAIKAHPEWFMRYESGEYMSRNEGAKKTDPLSDDRIYWTCMFTPYFTEQIPSIMREINRAYDIDGFFAPSWPTSTKPKPCFCETCRRFPQEGPALLERTTVRTLEVVRLWDSLAREKRPQNIYVMNTNGSIEAQQDQKLLTDAVHMINADHQARRDHQGRTGDAPIWNISETGRILHAVAKVKPRVIVTAANSTTRLLWRHISKCDAELTMQYAQSVASGAGLLCAWLGGDDDDRRWREPTKNFFQWHARHEEHFVNRKPMANLGMLLSQSLNAVYAPPKDSDTWEYIHGLYAALLDGRFVFDLVHENDLGADTLKKYSALILPNVAVLSDAQVAQLRQYVESGGSLLATFETGLFNNDGKPREDFPFGDVFDIKRVGARQGALGPDASSYYGRIEKRHEILQGFENTSLLPGCEYRIPVKSSSPPILTVLPPEPGHPPELVYSEVKHTDEPAIVLRETGPSRLVYFPGDIDRSYWRSGHPDISRLLCNAITWVTRGQSPVIVAGEGLAEIYAWETAPGFAVHLLNYNNPNATYGWLHHNYPLAPQRVTMQLPEGAIISRAHLLRAESPLQFRQNGRTVEFVIPRVDDYEVAALYAR